MDFNGENQSLQRKKLCHSSRLHSRMMLIEFKFIHKKILKAQSIDKNP